MRGRFALAEKHAGKGAVVYLTRSSPPPFLVEAVTAAGGIVFDGTRELRAPRPASLTVQLDAAFCDLAIAVRRRLKIGAWKDALEVRELELRRRPPAPGDAVARWTAVLELMALTGEAARADRPGRWIEAPDERVPFAMSLPKGERMLPARLAERIVDGGDASLRGLVDVPEPVIAPRRPRVYPLLCDRARLDLDRLTWRRLVADDLDAAELPVVVYVEGAADALAWPQDQGPPTPELERAAISNLAHEPVDVLAEPIPGGTLVMLGNSFHAAEHLLVSETMRQVQREVGDDELLVATPARGMLFAVSAARALLDDDLRATFLRMVKTAYAEAPEAERISPEALRYATGKPLGRLSADAVG